MDVGLVVKENYCEAVSVIYAIVMGKILVDGVNVFGLDWNGEPIAPAWNMLITILIAIAIRKGCRALSA